MVAPSWQPGGVTPDPEALAAEVAHATGRPPRLTVCDLTTPRVLGESWSADMVVSGSDAARVALVADFVLAARAARAVPDAAELARRRGLPPEAAQWDVAAIPQ